jgi:hypothetical protein
MMKRGCKACAHPEEPTSRRAPSLTQLGLTHTPFPFPSPPILCRPHEATGVRCLQGERDTGLSLDERTALTVAATTRRAVHRVVWHRLVSGQTQGREGGRKREIDR